MENSSPFWFRLTYENQTAHVLPSGLVGNRSIKHFQLHVGMQEKKLKKKNRNRPDVGFYNCFKKKLQQLNHEFTQIILFLNYLFLKKKKKKLQTSENIQNREQKLCCRDTSRPPEGAAGPEPCLSLYT